MSATSVIIAFAVVVVILVVFINRPWNADVLWERQAAQLRAEGIVAERPADWDVRVQQRRTQFIYVILFSVVVIAVWFGWSLYHWG